MSERQDFTPDELEQLRRKKFSELIQATRELLAEKRAEALHARDEDATA